MFILLLTKDIHLTHKIVKKRIFFTMSVVAVDFFIFEKKNNTCFVRPNNSRARLVNMCEIMTNITNLLLS